jgi:L-fuculose-phosphate aldolase
MSGPSSRERQVSPDPVFDAGREGLIHAGRLLGGRGLIVADDGNLSMRCPDGTIWITASGVRKDALTQRDLVRIDREGKVIEGSARPSSEFRLHTGIYEHRPDVGAVVHAHPPIATGFAVAGEGIPDSFLAEAAVRLGPVPVVPYRTPGTREAVEVIVPFLASHQAFLLANHGAVALGCDVEDACRRMERLEHVARSLLVARLLGGGRPLTAEERKGLKIMHKEDRDGWPTGS